MTVAGPLRILVANRGEIARRIIRTAHRLGHETVAAWADPDADAPFVAEATVSTRLGPAELDRSYLSVDALLDAADRAGATALHPGYGFLSERADLARAVVEAGLTWIGPHADAIDRMGSKIEARRLAGQAGVPVIPGYDRSQDSADLADAAAEIGYPVLVKAAAGGGGRGIRVVHDRTGFADALAEARSEAERTFGDGAMIVERFVTRPRHVEVQVVGDQHGTVLHLGTRECSVQRRYQKVLEEAPAPNLPDATRRGLLAAALALATEMAYDSAGTVEMIVDDDTGDHFFLEMNTRLQVEHPVTELVTGLDLVELMIRSAVGDPLGIRQDDVRFRGHAIECRVNAEDPTAGFAPQTGTITHLRVPAGVRWDSGVEQGGRISPHYDSMVAKLVTHGPDRDAARRRALAALDGLIVGGVVTNTGLHRWLLRQPAVVAGRVTTRFLDETELPAGPHPGAGAGRAAAAWAEAGAPPVGAGPWDALGAFRATPHRPERVVALRDRDGDVHEVTLPAGPSDADEVVVRSASSVDRADSTVAVNVDGHTLTYTVLDRSEHWAPAAGRGHGRAGDVVAPFPAVVAEVSVVAGEEIAAGDVVVVVEAMKMLHPLAATGPGVVAEVRVSPGDHVETGTVLVMFESQEVT